MDVTERIKRTVEENPIVLFMKGTPDFPQCGFSMRTAQALKACNVDFAYVDVLAEPDVRANLPVISNWPTFPQVFVNGELIGGCDIVLDMFQKGELQTIVQEAVKEK
ncbi:MAG: monothiol glutaredoxin, Grx4 family [Gammaproteobacteria bacterium RIFCSPLOWO2_02_FULL_47_50]|jgi:monothiol glutaredoxin|nr:MAG: monothiol glutaredoxin, Grx4 family [Gammaproteobacteria bacterium RIFCSPLOWO2_01_FULL_47_190]OGT74995.1 MAG: monothiol glutaredoxin, Grx4 family [Gammaproteobacteria bacterium RIFCSPLOWO2_12_47_11]OGT80776.1 MAG: monothiol glutaredoxin, Grx4 family [Gammaproteobacteria bacterium RIFCSPLOWO2_02_FULL_47_50]OGT88059.1 MAG: monothiol glutaredoxin, Grx4 family [Gammaproteobacteria bacterium RIFCSPLOWO2_12_FULL_47_76]